ncbi:group II intron reverse transcriptase/maturase, partial [Streptococcus macedonicus]|nr:group II intron reverse transcriptase/maturase [Streptococcus macedonicus]
IWKQWKTKAKRRLGLLKLGVPRWLADKVSGLGNHYQLVACQSVLNQSISKPILTKRGLVNYMERHVNS